MFASKTISTVTIDDVIVTIQKLSGRALDDAAKIKHDERMVQALRLNAALSAPALAEAVAARAQTKAQEQAGDAPASADVDVEIQRERRYGQYDRPTVLRAGVRSWTSTDKLPTVASGLDDLDDAAADQLHRAILDLTLPAIDPAVAETERKND